MGSLRGDLLHAFRTLAKHRGYSFVVILTLALGIGANSAIFSAIYGVLLRPLPYHQGDQLVLLEQHKPLAGIEDMGFSVKEFFDYRELNRTLAGVVEYHTMWFNLIGKEEPERVQTGVVSADFFDVLGVKPLVGRTFVTGEDQVGAEPVLVLSNAYWQRAFNGDPQVVGKTFEMNDRIHTVVGVLPPVPQFPQENDVYMPAAACPFRGGEGWIENREARNLTVFARLKPGVTAGQAGADLATIAGRLQAEHPESYPKEQGYRATLTPLYEELTSRARPTLLLLLGIAGLVLLIACANVANLAFARLLRREREMAVRAALGAGRARLLGHLLMESTLLALVAGVLGFLLATEGLELLTAFAGRFTPRAHEIQMDWPVLIFTLVASIATGLVFGMMPALSSRVELVAALKEDGGTSTTAPGPQRARRALIVLQLALSFMVLVGAGLMVRSVVALQRVDPGFNPMNVLAVTLDLDWSKYASGGQSDAPALLRFYRSLKERLEGDPRVVSTAMGLTFPLNQSQPMTGQFLIQGETAEQTAAAPLADYRIVSPAYFETLGIPLLRGRTFTDMDDAEAPVVVVVNESMARRYWGGRDPIGARISSDGGETWDLVVGVVGDVKQYGLETEPADEMYYSFLQQPLLSNELLLRTLGDPLQLRGSVREAVRAIDPEQPVADFRTLEQVRSESLASPRLTTVLLVLFGLLALVIAATGIGGVIAFSVGQRTREIGVRMALGAERRVILGMVLKQAMSLVLAGLSLGVLGALALSRLVGGLLFGVAPTDPVTFAAVALVLVLVATLACFVPARRAATVDPLVALRAS
jgi:putative ABC transport system permease protein